jgi:thioredoxin reductase
VAELNSKPFPPGRYPLIVVGSGPGGMQLVYSLTRLGVDHAALSADDAPGGMFRKWPLFQRMLSWTKPYTGFEPGTRDYERFDWNSLSGDEPAHRGLMAGVMDGTSYFPSRPEMQRGLELFAERTGLKFRYGCRWESTSKEDRDYILTTTDGDYRAPLVVFAVGVSEPWSPPSIPGIEQASHYGELGPTESYADKRIFIIGKQNSGFEIASGLLPWARRIILASPSSTQLSVNTHSLVGVRARYVQPYEDSVLAGGVVILDASIEEVARTEHGFDVRTRSRDEDHSRIHQVDTVIAATGFTSPLQDLDRLGVMRFGQSKLPAQSHLWESIDEKTRGIFFAGTINQGSKGVMKHGIPSNSGAVQGYRYNAKVLAQHIAETYFGKPHPTRPLQAGEVIPLFLHEARFGPELWHQRSYLARVVSIDPDRGLRDEGIMPLAHFLDGGTGYDGAAITLESNGHDDLYPRLYVRRHGKFDEHVLPVDPFLNFETERHQSEIGAALSPVLSESLSRP